MIGAKTLQHHAEMSRKNQEAENRHVRQTLWGNDGGSEDDVHDNYLGDVTVQPPKQSSVMPALLAMALGTAIPGAGVAGYFINQALTTPTPPAVGEPAIDTSVTIGLGRIEDYVSE